MKGSGAPCPCEQLGSHFSRAFGRPGMKMTGHGTMTAEAGCVKARPPPRRTVRHTGSRRVACVVALSVGLAVLATLPLREHRVSFARGIVVRRGWPMVVWEFDYAEPGRSPSSTRFSVQAFSTTAACLCLVGLVLLKFHGTGPRTRGGRWGHPSESRELPGRFRGGGSGDNGIAAPAPGPAASPPTTPTPPPANSPRSTTRTTPRM